MMLMPVRKSSMHRNDHGSFEYLRLRRDKCHLKPTIRLLQGARLYGGFKVYECLDRQYVTLRENDSSSAVTCRRYCSVARFRPGVFGVAGCL
jgi:hypothetical protein